ncbi:hypothetical protein F5884DRAFT_350010 [Xylogone sp. PMI_703]|nr:hypothetical protein F5884DRAFT_350010 [Xylogone sp. PMI_703]
MSGAESNANSHGSDQPFNIAIVGGGIVGLVLALGLVRRNIPVTIYEQSSGFREIGAGLVFASNAVRAMKLIDARLIDALDNIATFNGDEEAPDFFRFLDGYHHNGAPDDTTEKLLFTLYTGHRGLRGCHRAQMMDQLARFLPADCVVFGKRLESLEEAGDDRRVILKFEDGTTAQADAVIGCDGIKSRVRQLLLGKDNPASYPQYTHKFVYRGLVAMDKAEEALGHYKAHNLHFHMGPGAHILTYPVDNHKVMNVTAVVSDPNDWDSIAGMTAPASRDEVAAAFGSWSPGVRAIVNLLSDPLDKWGIFDSYNHPAPTYTRGRVCLAGDAAHASSPHHGAGASMGVEDALALSSLLERVVDSLSTRMDVSKAHALRAAFAAYDQVRRERTQWLVGSSRDVCETYHWINPQCGFDPDKCLADIRWRNHRIWHFDLDYMMGEAGEEYKRLLRVTDKARI